MKSSYATICGTVVLTAAVLASGCKREDPDRTPFDNRVFMTDVTPVRLLVERETSELEGLLAARTAKPVDEPVALTYSADESLVSLYNDANAAAALPLPAENFRMDDPTAEIPAGGVSASECTVNFVGLDALDFSEDQTYVLPVRLTEASGVDILTSRSVNFFVIREAALINVVGDIEGSYLDVEWKDPSPVSSMTQMTAEALVRFRNFDREITTLMGVEGKFLIRVGDSSFPSDQIQVTNGSYAKFPTVGNTANALPVNEWVHIAVTYDSGRLCIYVNGKLQSSGTCGYGAVNWGTYAAIDQEQSTRGFHIGYSYERKRELAGEIAEVRVWNRVLTADEIAAPDHFYTVDPASENLVAYWKFNDGAGNVVRDWSPYGNDATAPEGMKWTQVELPEK